jgi:division protein 1
MAPLGDPTSHPHYQSAMGEVHKQLRRPMLQRNVFSMARTTPTDLVRSTLSSKEIQSRALSYVPDEMLQNIPEDENQYSLFQGFQATFPEFTEEGRKHRRRVSRGRKLLEETETGHGDGPHGVHKLRKEKASMMHQFEMLGVRKNMASCEIREIDNKMANLMGMRRIILERLANLEQEEALLEHEST